jgi:hypothetical protein
MAKDKPIWSGKRVMRRWSCSPTELASLICDSLRAFRIEKGERIEVKPEEIQHYDEQHMTDLLFRPVDVEEFEKRPGLMEVLVDRGAALAPPEARELGQLREEKKKWDASIDVAVQTGIHCVKRGDVITRDQLTDFIVKIAVLPDTTIDKIWKALPDQYRKASGRPKKARAKSAV